MATSVSLSAQGLIVYGVVSCQGKDMKCPPGSAISLVKLASNTKIGLPSGAVIGCC
jgi:hypothetical protein